MVGVALLAGGVALSGPGAPAGADVPKLGTAGAYGYYSSVSLFGGPANNAGPNPAVTLPPDGTRAPVTTAVPSAKVQVGPAVLLESGEVRVSIEGTPGPNGSTTSTATVAGIRDQPLPLLYERASSTCTARGSELSGSTTLAGQLATSTYVAPDPREGDAKDLVPLPPSPAPNTERTGELSNVGDRFRVVFNEQVRDGAILTVNAIHMYLLGPIAIGDVVIGQSRCGPGSSTAPASTAPGPTSTSATTVITTTHPSPAAPETTLPAVTAADDEASSGSMLPLAVGGIAAAAVVGALLLSRRSRARSFGQGRR